jgi:2',3'-cyclic-nucleotide 2'-phosphodiesterase/3'-nucleotidase
MRIKSRVLTALKILVLVLPVSCTDSGYKTVSILETTDIHGVILPYDFTEREELNVSMASTFSYISQVRGTKNAVVLLDNGDNLQGQPAVYYYNFIDTVSPHFLAEVMNFMGYDAGTVGNHDIEAGHSVYDRLVNEYNFPLLAANAVNTETGEPYFKPYHIIEKEGVRIAIFGLVTPSIPNWLPMELYEGMEFRNMLETTEEWMPLILNEKPDVVVGLFHSGWDSSYSNSGDEDNTEENGVAAVAYNVRGFDIIFTGHDHKPANEKFVNSSGDTLLILNGGSKSQKIAQADIVISSKKVDGRRERKISGKLINVADNDPDEGFISRFSQQNKIVRDYVNQEIGTSSASLSSRDAYFGPSAFVGLIHTIQLEITGADISFAAPLSFDVQIPKGPITVGDMFKLYRFENMLYTMSLSGEEIQKYLEYSYSGWLNTMKKSSDALLKFRTGKNGKPLVTDGKVWLKNQPYNFDSAFGIDYTVDVSKPEGSRVVIHGFSDGRPFVKNNLYHVAVNSYRGNGGGGHFTAGSGIDKDDLRSRLVSSTERDLRYYILKSIEASKTVDPKVIKNWKIIPEKWIEQAAKRDSAMLFSSKN